MQAQAVARLAAGGAMSAARGMRVGSEPVTSTGPRMLTAVATVQMQAMAATRPRQRDVSSARFGTKASMTRYAMAEIPQVQAVIAARGRCSCSLPLTMSGDRTETRIVAAPMAAQTWAIALVRVI